VPPPDNTTPSERLRALVREEMRRAGVGERKFEERVGLRKWTLRGFLDPDRQQSPSLDRAAEIAAALGLHIQIGRLEAIVEPGMADPPRDHDLGKPEALRAGFLPIPYHSASSKRGMGPVAFSRAWLADVAPAPDHLAFVAVQQSLLAPAVPVDALALVDSAARRGQGPDQWCFRENGVDVIAYLTWMDRGLMISGAAGQPPRIVAKSGVILPLGRVVWTGALPG